VPLKNKSCEEFFTANAVVLVGLLKAKIAADEDEIIAQMSKVLIKVCSNFSNKSVS